MLLEGLSEGNAALIPLECLSEGNAALIPLECLSEENAAHIPLTQSPDGLCGVQWTEGARSQGRGALSRRTDSGKMLEAGTGGGGGGGRVRGERPARACRPTDPALHRSEARDTLITVPSRRRRRDTLITVPSSRRRRDTLFTAPSGRRRRDTLITAQVRGGRPASACRSCVPLA
jgi:hypothetical protein